MTPSTRCDARSPSRAPLHTRRAAGALSTAAILLFGPSPARADNDPVAAEALFKSARALIEAGDYAAGCPKFEASLAMSPSASTMLNIAKCHEHDGKLATAWADYNRALVLNNHETKGEERKRRLEAVAKEGLAALEPRIPKLRVRVPKPPAGLKVARDDSELPLAALDEELPVDPGAHQIKVSAPGYRSETRSVTLEPGEIATVELTLTKDASPVSDKAAPRASDKASGGGVPLWVWVSGGGGLALLGTAAYFLADDLAAIDALREGCPSVDGKTYCKPGYDYASDNARKNRDLGLTLGLGGAGAFAVGAAIFGLVQSLPGKQGAPGAAARASAWVSPTGAGAALRGEF